MIEGRVRIGPADGDEPMGTDDDTGSAGSDRGPGAEGSDQGPSTAGNDEDGGSADVAARGRFDSLDSFLEELDSIADSHECIVQAFDARYVAGPGHLRSAVEHARRAIARGENVADSPAVEVLLYAAGRRQIDRAMEMGVDTGDQHLVVVAVGGDEAAAAEAIRERIQPASVEPDPERIESFFAITDDERSATDADLEALVVERVALLDVEK